MAGIPTIAPYSFPTTGELKPNIAVWRIDPARAVLLVHDMQRFFLRPLPRDSVAEPLIRNVAQLIKRARVHSVPVAYTAQPGSMTPSQRGLLKSFWGEGMKVDAVDRQIEQRCASIEGDWLLTKWRYSAFFQSDLLARMRVQGRQQLIVCGVYAHIGVLSTALDAFSNDIETFIVSDAVADFSRNEHVAALDRASQSCACVVPTHEVLA